MHDCAVEVAGDRELDDVQRLVSADEYDASEEGRGCVVGVIAAAGEVLAFHRTHHHLLVREGTVEQLIHAVCSGGAGRRAGTDTRAGIDLLADRHVNLGFLSSHFQELADDRSDDVVLDVLGERNICLVGDGDAVAFRGCHLQNVSDLVQGEAHDIETASEVGDGCRGEYSDLLHCPIRLRCS